MEDYRDTSSRRGNHRFNDTTTRRLADVAHDVVDETAAKAQALENGIRQTAEQAGERLEQTQEAASEQIERSLAKAESFVNERPFIATGIAFAVGVLAATMLRR